jgi:NAD+ diphosphatase
MQRDGLDRAAHLRTPEHLERVVSDPATVLVPVWRGKCLISDDGTAARLPTLGEARRWVEIAEERAFLGNRGDLAYLMVDLPRDEEPASLLEASVGGAFADLRFAAVHLPDSDFALLAYARGMAHFHRSERFDGKTGALTHATDAGFARAPDGGGDKIFARTDPAVMVLVTRGDQCLLARGPHFPPTMYSALAGFVEPGESLEACVAREVAEEVGLEVGTPRYVASQGWPFPRSLMIAFVAEHTGGEIRVDGTEIVEARWFGKRDLQSPEGFFVPPPFSLAHRLIHGYARGDW